SSARLGRVVTVGRASRNSCAAPGTAGNTTSALVSRGAIPNLYGRGSSRWRSEREPRQGALRRRDVSGFGRGGLLGRRGDGACSILSAGGRRRARRGRARGRQDN